MERLKQLVVLLSRPLPQAKSVRSDKNSLALWKLSIEELESKLVLLNAISGNSLVKNKARSAPGLNNTPLDLTDLSDVIDLLNLVVVDACLDKSSVASSSWRLKDVFVKLVRFKMKIASSPAERFTLMHIEKHHSEGGFHEIPPFVKVNTGSSEYLNIFRMHIKYSPTFGVTLFNSDLNDSLKPDYTEMIKDVDILVGLISYMINAGAGRKAVRFIEVLRRRDGYSQIGTALKVSIDVQ